MKTYKIEFQPTAGAYEATEYVKYRIEKIGADNGMTEKCEVSMDMIPDEKGNYEVAAYVQVPRHVYMSKQKGDSFISVAKNVFEDLSNQLSDLKNRMVDSGVEKHHTVMG
jgi:hypothetical protein